MGHRLKFMASVEVDADLTGSVDSQKPFFLTEPGRTLRRS